MDASSLAVLPLLGPHVEGPATCTLCVWLPLIRVFVPRPSRGPRQSCVIWTLEPAGSFPTGPCGEGRVGPTRPPCKVLPPNGHHVTLGVLTSCRSAQEPRHPGKDALSSPPRKPLKSNAFQGRNHASHTCTLSWEARCCCFLILKFNQSLDPVI